MNHFNVDSPASASSSTLIATPLDIKNNSFDSPNAIHVPRTPKPKLNLITTTSTSPPPTRMSSKGFIEPHRSHLPRRTRAKTAPNSTSSAGKTKIQTDPSTKGGNPPLSLDAHPTQQQQGQSAASDHSPERVLRVSDVPPTKKLSVSTKMTMSSKGFIEPHRSHLPRRAKTSPNQTGKRVPLPLPLFAVDSPLSLVQPETTVETELELPSEPIIPVPALLPFPTEVSLSLPSATTSSIGTPPPPPFSATAAALISIAQNKMTMADSKLDRDVQDCLSPVLPHPAMGLTMGLMEAAREAAEGASFAYGGTPIQTPQKTPVPTTLNPSPALGVFGSPTPSRTPIPVSSVGLLGNNLPRRHKRGRETNLRKASLKRGVVEEEESDGRGKDGEREELNGKVLRLVGVRRQGDEDDDGISSLLAPSHSKSYSRHGGHRACSAPAHGSSRTRSNRRDTSSERRCIQVLGRSRVEVGFWLDDLKDYVLLKTVDSLSSDSDSDNDDDSCLKLPLLGRKAAYKDGIPTLTNAQIRDGCEFMRRWIGKSSLLLPTVKTDSGDTSLMIRILTPRWRPEEAMGLALCYLARAEMEAPRSESEKGTARSVVQEDALGHPRVVPFGVNDLDLSLPSSETNLEVETEVNVFSMELPSRGDVIVAADDFLIPDAHYAYSSIHHLSMRLLDDDLGEWMGRRAMDEVGGTKDGRSGAVKLGLGLGLGLGILGAQAIREEVQVEGRSDSDTAGSSRQGRSTRSRRRKRGRTLFRYPPQSLLDNDKGKEKGLHVREAPFGGREGSLSISETCEGSDVQRASSVGDGIGCEWEKVKQRDWKGRRTWTGMRDEWRGVLSFEGLEGLVGIWPQCR